MVRLSLCAGAVGLAVSAGSAAAQSAEPFYADLPMRGEAPVLGVIPNVGATPGFVMDVQSPSAKCSADAIRAAEGLMAPADAVASCNEAITSPLIRTTELAGTHVNRGVLLLTMQQQADARRDFDHALTLDPDSAEALVNRGAMKIAEGRVAEGVADLDRAISLGPELPERAYYHRAVGREELKDLRGAYADYRMAQTLKPDWEAPTLQLSRFQVTRRAAR